MSDSTNVEPVAGGEHAPKGVMDLATALAKAHGCTVKVTNEKSGYHIYIPCPACLYTHARRELADMKYAINASKYLQLGDKYKHEESFIKTVGDRRAAKERDTRSSVCMRTAGSPKQHSYSISELLAMSAISVRHEDIATSAGVVGGNGSADKEKYWVEDSLGQKVPPPPGNVIPITQLPKTHPAVVYLEERGYSTDKLFAQFQTSYCFSELLPGREHNVWYRKMPGGWCDTPAGRIIFYAMHGGSAKTWQGRYIERTSKDRLELEAYHPYTGKWCLIATRSNAAAAWLRKSPYDEIKENGNYRWDPSKYRTATHSFRELMGWDAAVENSRDEDYSWCVLTEGPLDAARVGPGGIAIIGKSLNVANAAKIAKEFHIVYTAFDNDSAGKAATEKIYTQLMRAQARENKLISVFPIPVPTGVKDLGEMKQDTFDKLFKKVVRKSKRILNI